MRVVNLPTDLLRTFVTVIEVKSHTRAADLLNRSQPAVSLQIKRLEDLVGYKLIRQKGRTVIGTLLKGRDHCLIHHMLE